MTTTISFTPTRCIMGGGNFDTDFRYIRAASAGATFPLPKQKTIRIAPDNINARYVMWRWSTSLTAMEFQGNGSPTGLGSPTATIVTI